jgi:hypothetical protein
MDGFVGRIPGLSRRMGLPWLRAPKSVPQIEEPSKTKDKPLTWRNLGKHTMSGRLCRVGSALLVLALTPALFGHATTILVPDLVARDGAQEVHLDATYTVEGIPGGPVQGVIVRGHAPPNRRPSTPHDDRFFVGEG